MECASVMILGIFGGCDQLLCTKFQLGVRDYSETLQLFTNVTLGRAWWGSNIVTPTLQGLHSTWTNSMDIKATTHLTNGASVGDSCFSFQAADCRPWDISISLGRNGWGRSWGHDTRLQVTQRALWVHPAITVRPPVWGSQHSSQPHL